MGYQVIVDIIGSAFIGGILLMTLLNMKAANTENNYKYYGNQALQENLIALTELLDNDLKQIGYAKDSTYISPILIASADRLKFLTTIKPDKSHEPDGSKDQLEYYFNGADNTTPNPNDKILTRTVTTSDPNFNQGAAAVQLNYGIVKFKFKYMDFAGAEITSTASQAERNGIYSILLDVTIQRPFIYNRSNVDTTDQYNRETVRWQRVFYPNKTGFKNSR